MIKEIHGVVARVSGKPAEVQHVRIMDGDACITFYHTKTDGAVLSSEEARLLAKFLMQAATRLDARMASK